MLTCTHTHGQRGTSGMGGLAGLPMKENSNCHAAKRFFPCTATLPPESFQGITSWPSSPKNEGIGKYFLLSPSLWSLHPQKYSQWTHILPLRQTWEIFVWFTVFAMRMEMREKNPHIPACFDSGTVLPCKGPKDASYNFIFSFRVW